MDKTIALDLADQTARNFGRADADFAGKMARRIRRKFTQTISREAILEQALHFRMIYEFASASLVDCLKPSEDGYAHSSNVDNEKYMSLLVKRFPQEERETLETISGWVIYYDYLH